MTSCPACQRSASPDARFCPHCGASLAGLDGATRTHASASAWPVGLASEDAGRFEPGTRLAGRYRIVGLLGRGGMGEVYRADDLKLGQAVALKFLPPAMAADGATLARFHREVRVARRISHPNVCRVFDIGEVDGQHFLSMEYIDGEDLSSLIRRIGRLPADKAIDVAKQLCAGLAAAHETGVLHRDLKPANVMIDGRGRARLTDFGLAGFESELRGADVSAGTPSYMAPEQLDGREVTARSDVYALGLLLHEMFTGQRVWSAGSLAELKAQRAEGSRASASSLIPDLDPLVERVIERCLEVDPAARPASALQVAAALPGGSPLEAALAAGETPSPAMVAAAPLPGALGRRAAVSCLAGIGVLLVALCFSDVVNLHRRVPLGKSPEVLADRAATFLAAVGAEARPAARAWGVALDESYFASDDDPLPPARRWRRLSTGQPLAYYFWFRQSPVPLEPSRADRKIAPDSPPAVIENMAGVVLDLQGRLVSCDIVPPAFLDQAAKDVSPGNDVAWGPWWAAAGLDSLHFTPTAPTWTPPTHVDNQRAWLGTFADHPDLPLRVEAATNRGRVVHFRVIAPWDRPPSARPPRGDVSQVVAAALVALLVASVIAGATFLARRNLTRGKVDRAGAWRLAVVVFGLQMVGECLGSRRPVTANGAMSLGITVIRDAALTGLLMWLLYVALEPVVRRQRPHLLVGWTRLLAGDNRDPLVGRDILLGTLLGLGSCLAHCLAGWLKIVCAVPQPPSRYVAVSTLNGLPSALEFILTALVQSVFLALALLILLALLKPALRSERRAAALMWLVMTALFVTWTVRSWPAIGYTAISNALLIFALARFGLAAAVAYNFALSLTQRSPLTTDLSVWYADATAASLLVLALVTVFAFRATLAGQPGSRRHGSP